MSRETRQHDLQDELQNFEELARAVKPSPGEIPSLRGVDIGGLSMPLRGVIGGDHLIYIDFDRRYDLDSRIAEAERSPEPGVAERLRVLKSRAGILVADVSGHRITDALIAAMLHQAFLLAANYELDQYGEITTRIFEHMNTRFHRTTSFNKYVTMIYGEISDEGAFRFISAGHPPPAVFSREFGRFMPISKDLLVSFPPLGMFPSRNDPDARRYRSRYGYKEAYSVNEIQLLAPGDILLLYTDGLSEHAGGGFFPDRVERLLAESAELGASALCDRLREEILAAGAPDDDLSVVVIKKN
jgi:serine phosphatase RsbU (regulator of sigma subunit)